MTAPVLVYIAGPYAPCDGLTIEQNVQRAALLGRLAVLRGYVPVIPHLPGWHGVYGDATEGVDGVRERALRAGLALVDVVRNTGGELWAIKRADGTLSDGTHLELQRFLHHPAGVFRQRSWSGWETELREVGLVGAEVDRLRAPIPMVLHCPACGEQHVDAPHEGWDNPPHRSHLCHRCDHIWRPADVATTGVRAIETRGTADSPRAPPSAVAELERVRDLVWAMANEVEDTRTVACRELADRLRALTKPLGVSP